jgi:predicted nucleotidyltransferase component of viral defense system
MKFDAAQITKLARDMGFPADSLEKVLRLRELLAELHKHPFLQGKLVLKGGTALNLFYLDLARLSVDIDLNYIEHVDREATQRERPEIMKAAGWGLSMVSAMCQARRHAGPGGSDQSIQARLDVAARRRTLRVR